MPARMATVIPKGATDSWLLTSAFRQTKPECY
jgi:hypothetical protein